jgi:hypothetical protein
VELEDVEEEKDVEEEEEVDEEERALVELPGIASAFASRSTIHRSACC